MLWAISQEELPMHASTVFNLQIIGIRGAPVMVLSSTTVVSSALTLKTWKPKDLEATR